MRSARPPRSLACALLAVAVFAAGVGACSQGSNQATATATATAFGAPSDLSALDRVTVTEAAGPTTATASPTSDADAPTNSPGLTLPTTPFTVSDTARRIVTAGSGPTSGGDSLVSAHLTVFLGSSGQQLDSTYRTGEPISLSLSNAQTITGLLTGLTGVQAGSRVLLGIPPDDAYGPEGNPSIGISGTESLLVLADVLQVAALLAGAQGTPASPVAGLPAVAFDPATGPTVTVPTGAPAPADTVTQTLVDGSGAPIAPGQLVSVHYTGVLWRDGSVFDSSWTTKAPFSFLLGAGQVIPAWDAQLVGKKVGSRLLLVVAPKDGYGAEGNPPKIAGTDTLVFVVDILGAL